MTAPRPPRRPLHLPRLGAPPVGAFTAGALLVLLCAPAGAQPCPLPSHSIPCPGPERWNTAFGAGGVMRGALAGAVRAAVVFRGELIVGGAFTSLGAVPANNLARWSPITQTWAPLGPGVGWSVPGNLPEVLCLAVFDADGAGPAPELLYIGGYFDRAGELPCTSLVRWDGASFSTVGACAFTGSDWSYFAGTFAAVRALQPFTVGAEPRLYIAGDFSTKPCGGLSVRIARWRPGNDTWEGVPSLGAVGDGAEVNALAVFDEGAGPRLFAGGLFGGATCSPCTTVNNLARLNPASGAWTPLGSPAQPGVNQTVLSLLSSPDPSSPIGRALAIGGRFSGASDGTASPFIIKWDGAAFTPLNTPNPALINKEVSSLTRFNGALHAGMSGPGLAEVVRRAPNGAWVNLGAFSGIAFILALIPFHDDAGGRALYTFGAFPCVDNSLAGGVARFSSCCPGDTDGSRTVDFLDLNAVLAAYGASGPLLDADLDADQFVGFADLNLALAGFGSFCP